MCDLAGVLVILQAIIVTYNLRGMEEALARRRAIASGEIWASRIPCSLANSVSGSPSGDRGTQVKLFLGSGQDASNAEKLRDNGVTHIVNVADDVENFHPGQFVYCNLNVTDFGGDAGISRVFEQAADFIGKATLTCESDEPGVGPGILVHCANGSNRSSTVVIACLMILQGLDLKTALDIVKKAHGKTHPLGDNRMQLMDFERRLYPRKADTDYFTFP